MIIAYLAKHQCFVPSKVTAKSKQKCRYTDINSIMQTTIHRNGKQCRPTNSVLFCYNYS